MLRFYDDSSDEESPPTGDDALTHMIDAAFVIMGEPQNNDGNNTGTGQKTSAGVSTKQHDDDDDDDEPIPKRAKRTKTTKHIAISDTDDGDAKQKEASHIFSLPPNTDYSDVIQYNTHLTFDEHSIALISSNIQKLLLSATDNEKNGLSSHEPARLINYDSHDDWGCPPDPVTDNARKSIIKNKVPASIDIGTWILPAVIWGVFDELVWVTAFARISPCDFNCHVYRDKENHVRVSPIGRGTIPPEWQTIWENNYDKTCPYRTDALKKTNRVRTVRFVVVMSTESSETIRTLQRANPRKKTVLTVDMDYFEAKNPSKEIYNNRFDKIAGHVELWEYAANIALPNQGDFFRLLETDEPIQSKATALNKLLSDNPAPNVPLDQLRNFNTEKAADDAIKAFNTMSENYHDLVYTLLYTAYLTDMPSVTRAAQQTLYDRFCGDLTVIDGRTLSFPVLIAQSTEYSNDTERVIRMKITNACVEKLNAFSNKNN